MGISQSKPGIPKEEMKFKSKKGTHETQISEGGEADLQQHFDSCKKNPGHTDFVPINDFNINHLPEDHFDNELVEFIKATADLTVRVDVTMTSRKRPRFWPTTLQPYPGYGQIGSDVMRLGTGIVSKVNKFTEEDIMKENKGTCTCHKCIKSDTPSKVWGEIQMITARHVVIDDLEARKTTCRLLYDSKDSPLVLLAGWREMCGSIKADWCELKCVICDVYLLDKLKKMREHWFSLLESVDCRYENSHHINNFTFIVSHPHGYPKQVSVGRWINKYENSPGTQYTYTTCTCPGSSGAHVHSLGYMEGSVWFYFVQIHEFHVHSGAHSEGLNYSGTGRVSNNSMGEVLF